MEDQKKQDYEFVTETIKKKPVNKKKIVLRIVHSVGMGILAGVVACVIFAIFAPKVYTYLNPEEPNLVSIPEDIQDMNSDKAEDIEAVTDSEDKTITTGENASINTTLSENGEIELKEVESVDEDAENPDGETDAEEEEIEPAEVEEPKTVVIEKEELTLDDYKKFYHELTHISNVAKRSITKVTGVTNRTDWFNNSYEAGNVSTGLIIADNGKELLIITNSSKLETSKEIEVTFCNDKSFKGTVKKSDSSTGLTVVAVVLDDIDDSTKHSYAPAKLGNSTIPTLVGTPIIALGAPLGIEDSMATGIVTSNSHEIEQTDANIKYITTDIYGSADGSGVIVDLDGNVLGIIFQGGLSSDTKNLVHAYAISDIKSKIEKLLNGQETAYLGIIGMDVSKTAMEELNVPEGAYVKQVVVDSPAMSGGIQNGDVIVKLGTTDIRTFNDYKLAISKCQPGDTAMVTVKRLGKDGYVEFSYEIYLEALK